MDSQGPTRCHVRPDLKQIERERAEQPDWWARSLTIPLIWEKNVHAHATNTRCFVRVISSLLHASFLKKGCPSAVKGGTPTVRQPLCSVYSWKISASHYYCTRRKHNVKVRLRFHRNGSVHNRQSQQHQHQHRGSVYSDSPGLYKLLINQSQITAITSHS